MSRPKRKEADRSLEKAASSRAKEGEGKRSRTAFVIASVVIALILAIVGVSYYANYVAPFRRVIITVGNTPIRVDYFLKRARLSGATPMDMLDVLSNEQIIKQTAPRYGIDVTAADIDQELRRIASGENQTISDSEFREWYRQQLNESRLSDSDFREIKRTQLLAFRLQQYLAERVPTVGEQVHLYAIQLNTYEEAQKAKARWQAGEDFFSLARELSQLKESGEKGGELGWVPRGVLPGGFDSLIFDLSSGNITDPVPFGADPSDPNSPVQYFLFMVSEKAVARELDELSRQTLQANALQQWLLKEAEFHQIRYNYNSEIDAWLNWQLAKK